MITQVSNLLNLPVISQHGELLGEISDVVFDHENGNILGFLLKTKGFLSKPQAISTNDVVTFHRKVIILNSSDSVVEIPEVVRLQKEIDSKIKILEARAITESGKRLGSIENLLINTETGSIIKYYIKSVIAGRRIIPAEKVIEIKKEGVIFSEDVTVGTALSSEVVMA